MWRIMKIVPLWLEGTMLRNILIINYLCGTTPTARGELEGGECCSAGGAVHADGDAGEAADHFGA